jgi:hypothetical protein
MADLFQIEAYRTFEYYGFFVDHMPDAQRVEWRDGLPVPRAINSGRADNIIMGDGCGCAVEVKTAGGANYRRLAFADPKAGWKDEQRRWAEKWCQKGNTYWLWVTFGERIGGKKWPRVTYLADKTSWEGAENAMRDENRKSIAYEWAATHLADFALQWAGDQRWIIPAPHPFWLRVRRPAGSDSSDQAG